MGKRVSCPHRVKKPPVVVAESSASNRGSAYYPLDQAKKGSGFFTSDNSSSPFLVESVVMRQNSGRRAKGEMTTFGKKAPDIENSIKKYLDSVHYEASPIIVTQQGQPPLSLPFLSGKLCTSSRITEELQFLLGRHGRSLDSRCSSRS